MFLFIVNMLKFVNILLVFIVLTNMVVMSIM